MAVIVDIAVALVIEVDTAVVLVVEDGAAEDDRGSGKVADEGLVEDHIGREACAGVVGPEEEVVDWDIVAVAVAVAQGELAGR